MQRLSVRHSVFVRVLDVDVDDPLTGRPNLVAIAKAVGVTTPLVTYEQVRHTVTSYRPRPE